MNISQLVRSLLGDAIGGEPRALELRIGQVVRGVVLQMLDNREAVVQINGLQVRAKLESSLRPGQSALLQVLPQSNEGLIVLKQAETNAGAVLGHSAADWLKQLELPDQKWAHDFVRTLRASGTDLAPETAAYFRQAAAGMPQDADPAKWMQAAGTAFGRGLPPTAATIDALRHALFGRPLHELLGTLGRILAPDGEFSGVLPQAALRLQALLSDGEALLRGVSGESGGFGTASFSSGFSPSIGAASVPKLEIGSSDAAEAANANGAADLSKTGVGGGGSALTGSGTASGSGPAVPPPPAGSPAATGSGWLGQLMKWLGVDHERGFANSVMPGAATLSGGAPAMWPGSQGSARDAQQETAAADPRQTDPAQAPHSRAAGGQAADVPPPSAAEGLPRSGGERVPPGGGAAADAPHPAREHALPAAQESLKSALLALVSSGDAPDALRDSAQQLLGHITGQQLLMAPERSGAMFSHMTLFVPLFGPDGGRTASIQVQARRGRRGELDADNCRLLFELSMHTLGNALVDVNVMDKIVSVTMWNDHPAVGRLAESFKTEMAEKLGAAGYKLLSLRTAEFPDRTEAAAAAVVPDMQGYAPNRYKGVDVRA